MAPSMRSVINLSSYQLGRVLIEFYEESLFHLTGRLQITPRDLFSPAKQKRNFISCSQMSNMNDLNNPGDIKSMRVPYGTVSQEIGATTHREPFGLFAEWFEKARTTDGIHEPNAMVLATATRDGIPSARFVLLKEFSKHGFTFFTNYLSRKGIQLEENPKAALTFYWDVLHRQVRIEGSVEKVPTSESEAYFNSRPRDSQLSAAASNQSQRIESRDVLLAQVAKLDRTHPDVVPKPEQWGGYRVIPERIEFWQGQTDRLHDRLLFRRSARGDSDDSKLTHAGENGWLYESLAP